MAILESGGRTSSRVIAGSAVAAIDLIAFGLIIATPAVIRLAWGRNQVTVFAWRI